MEFAGAAGFAGFIGFMGFIFRSHTVNRLYVNFKTRRWRSKKEAYPLQTL